jgi:hypothetical protein
MKADLLGPIFAASNVFGRTQLVSNEKIECIVNSQLHRNFDGWFQAFIDFRAWRWRTLSRKRLSHNQSNEAEYFVADLIHLYNSHFKIIIYYNFDLSF